MSEVITFYENKKKRNYRNKICGSNFVGISGEIIFISRSNIQLYRIKQL